MLTSRVVVVARHRAGGQRCSRVLDGVVSRAIMLAMRRLLLPARSVVGLGGARPLIAVGRRRGRQPVITNPPEEVFAVVKLHYGGSAGIAEGLRTFGFESLADAMGPKMSELFEIASFNAEYAMVQRLGFCLNGVGQNLGTGGISQAKLFSPSAAAFLRRRGLSRTYDEEEPVATAPAEPTRPRLAPWRKKLREAKARREAAAAAAAP